MVRRTGDPHRLSLRNIGYVCVRGNWTNRDFAVGMILLPGLAGSMLGFVAGAVVAVVNALR